MSKSNSMRRDIHADITNQLIAAIEADPGRPTLPWLRGGGPLHMPVNALTGKAYSGINVLNLWVMAEVKRYATPLWGTYRQWADKGAQVRKGETASLIVFYKEYEVIPDAQSADDDGKRRVIKGSAVFNAAQVDGFIPPQSQFEDLGPVERLLAADAFATATGATIRTGGDKAYYDPSSDCIQMPDEGRFYDTSTLTRTEGYYATLTHELVHWSGAPKRLNRDMGKRFGDKLYAAEELVAEIGAAFLCAELGISQATKPDHAQYLASWLTLLKEDSRAIFAAAARASEAVRYLHRRE